MSRSSSIRPIALPALLLSVVLAGCAGPVPSAPPTSPTTPSASGGAAGLETFYEQDLSWGSCDGYASSEAEAPVMAIDGVECARLAVPLDYADPGSRTIELALSRIKAAGGAVGSVVVNPGGPAAPGVSFAAVLGSSKGWAPLYEKFDLVGFDMRGTGASTPTVDCFTDAERDDDALIASFLFGGETWTEDETRRVAQACADGSGGADVISHLGSRDTARDMDVLREVLGDQQLNFLGASYGTRLGAVYAEMFPQNLRAMVLDGGMDPNLGIEARMVQQYGGFQSAFNAWAADCATRPGCPVGSDPRKATERFQELVRPLTDRPIAVQSAGRPLTYRSAVEAVLRQLYSEKQGWPVITKGLTELAAGRGETLLAARDLSHQRQADGSYSTLLEGALVTHCNDRERLTPQQETALRKRMLTAAPFMDDGRDRQARDVCEHWPSEPTLTYPYATKIDDLPPTLMVSITGDPASPHESGIGLAKTLGSGLLTVEGNQHGAVITAGNECVDRFVADYLINLTLPPADARCSL